MMLFFSPFPLLNADLREILAIVDKDNLVDFEILEKT